MKTVIETPTFTHQAGKIWTEEDEEEFIDYISSNPTAGDLITNSDGARKYAGNPAKGQVKAVELE